MYNLRGENTFLTKDTKIDKVQSFFRLKKKKHNNNKGKARLTQNII